MSGLKIPIRRGSVLKTGQTTSYVSGDDGFYQRGLLKAYILLTLGQYSGTTSITINSKTDSHTNNCVFDKNTGLMWSKNVSAGVGPSSTGVLPWTTTGSGGTSEGIFPYVEAANTVLLAGYSDWRVPNVFELMSLVDEEAPTGMPDSAAFPSFQTLPIWSSTTRPDLTTSAFTFNYSIGRASDAAKTATNYCCLVRG